MVKLEIIKPLETYLINLKLNMKFLKILFQSQHLSLF